MSWKDALEEFEQITICHLDGDDGVERRCIGNRLNCPVELTIGSKMTIDYSHYRSNDLCSIE